MSVRTVIICQGTGCVSAGAEQIHRALGKETSKLGLGETVQLKRTGCHGFCQQASLVVIEPEGILYTKAKIEDAPEIAGSFLPTGRPVERLFYRNPTTDKPIPFYRDIAFYGKQQRTVLKNCGYVDPENIEDYIASGGYQALRRVLFEMTPEEVIGEVMSSGLRGRGGAGFPTGQKWYSCRKSHGGKKYVICNADEGDPGAFQDRSVLESDPHSVMEGIIIAGRTVGAQMGYFYVRAEYPLAVKRLQIAIEQAREKGFLGKNILKSEFDFDIEIFQGAGAFVCGEETALILSIEGMRGMPMPRPPFPAKSGLWNRPTLINNVKTYANIRWIINKGADWFASRGTDKSKGTAIFSLTGKIANCGLIEVPMGITLREIIFDIGGGIPGGKTFKAVQTGGPSGGCLPSNLLDTPIDFDSLKAAGSMMGSGGMIVVNEDDCMVDLAKYFLEFTQNESCGKCTPCREGTKRMLEILVRITSGKGKKDDISKLERLANLVKKASLCGLGQTAPNPVLTTLRYFPEEYEEHINNKRCPAGICRGLFKYIIDSEKCKGCGLCLKFCPIGAIVGEKRETHKIDQEECTQCGRCLSSCKFNAIVKM